MNAYRPWGLKPQLDNIPPVFRQWRRWVVWLAVPRLEQQGKVDKIPRQPANWLRGASTNNPRHWADFELACRTYEAHADRLSGVGLVLTDCPGIERAQYEGLPLFAIDIDHAVDPDDERVVLLRKTKCYVEISPSGQGFRGLGFAELSATYVNHEAGVEVYDGSTPRYVTVTGIPANFESVRRPTRHAVGAAK